MPAFSSRFIRHLPWPWSFAYVQERGSQRQSLRLSHGLRFATCLWYSMHQRMLVRRSSRPGFWHASGYHPWPSACLSFQSRCSIHLRSDSLASQLHVVDGGSKAVGYSGKCFQDHNEKGQIRLQFVCERVSVRSSNLFFYLATCVLL